ncbi:type III pantothenate kinase [Stenotrophomonas mori]|uniref:Type III pantothenate kinase n=1 Tax=Stenotrophomonas mori TaxID=2871096 RepID=A0ABT0SJ29_9GAMM|nr:type III pantothenate kinase [Stenotrophomonas mori]MCL7715338.1 type III pantothenate kinase [Stenotrophomonas mori]
MSDWLFDLGNSRFKFAPLLGGDAGAVQAWPHGAEAMTAAALEALPQGGTAWVASVAAPALTATVLEILRARFQRVEVAHTRAECAGVRIAYARPQRFGVDRFLALLAARSAARPVLVVGVGTALTLDLMDARGRHLGGRIGASPTTMREALHARAVQLPATGGDYHEFASDTDDALASGCDGAAVALVERSLRHGAALLDAAPALVLHGGGAGPLAPLLPDAELRPTLVLDGLARWAVHAAAPQR